MSVEGYLSIIVRKWRNYIFSSKKAAIVSFTITAIFLCSDLYLNFVIDLQESKNNETMNKVCVSDNKEIDFYQTVK
jgi:hypothetical protein